MKNLILFLGFTMSFSAFAQDTITAAKAKEYIGKEVVVRGRIASFRLASEGKSTNLINIDSAYPNPIFTLVLSNQYLEDRKINVAAIKGKIILVKGTVTTYDKDPKKTPQIVNPIIFELK